MDVVLERRAAFVALALAGLALVAARGAPTNPDSKTQPLQDGCNRSSLGLLAEGVAGLTNVHHPTAIPSWVYVNGDRTPKTLVGSVIGTHTAGSDLFGVHTTYDANFDVVPDPDYQYLLSTTNAQESPPQIHTEWESGLVPTWAWPSPGDRVRETGSYIWDCGHWQGGNRTFSGSDNIPGDPLGTAGVEPIGGEAAEIHPIQELATWRAQGDFIPSGSTRPVHASRLDVYISNQGGVAKSVEECALVAPANPANGAERVADGQGCSTLQDITGRDYNYVLSPPGPRPNPQAQLMVQQDVRASHYAPVPVVQTVGDEVHITVPFAGEKPSSDLQDFGATWHAWWSTDRTRLPQFKITLERLTIYSNLDGDTGESNTDPSVDPPGEWNVYLDEAGQWRNLHDPRPGQVDEVPGLAKVAPANPPNGPPTSFDLSGLAPTDVVLPATGTFRMYVDARECDLPGYVDCPTNNPSTHAQELDFPQTPGRAEIVVPVSKLLKSSTEFTIHPVVCTPTQGCPEENSDPALCPAATGCYSLTFRVDDVDSHHLAVRTISGDGTAAGTVFGNAPASALSWWRGPITVYPPDQGEENAQIRSVILGMRG